MDERRAREAGSNGYLAKPFVDTDLSTAIQQAIADAPTKPPCAPRRNSQGSSH